MRRFCIVALLALLPLLAQPIGFRGRWNLTISGEQLTYPAWLEVIRNEQGPKIRMVGKSGSVKEIDDFHFEGDRLTFGAIENIGGRKRVNYELRPRAGALTGTARLPDGTALSVRGTLAPALNRPAPKGWARPVPLLNGRDLGGWEPIGPGQSRWKAEGPVLVNSAKGANLRSLRTFEDFKLHLEFLCPAGSNSGIYLRGRYEVQIEDGSSQGRPINMLGSIYGFLGPKTPPQPRPGEWRTLDVELVGRTVTVVLDGQTLIDAEEIPGTTGGALDSNEHLPGPFLIQGDHGPVEFRNILVSPAIR
ncbi:MAG: DUF1080 domain-containing protein [Bryobacteraceae bacterium]